MFCFSIGKNKYYLNFREKNMDKKIEKNAPTNSCLSKKTLANRLFKQP